MKINILLTASAATLISACSFAPIGNNSFECNRKDSPAAYCKSFKAVERSTNGTLPETKFEKPFDMNDYDAAFDLSVKADKDNKKDKAVAQVLPHNMGVANQAVVDGGPVRQAPVIQRMYIKKFVDENDVLHQDQIVYKEVKGSKWAGFDSGSAANNLNGGVLYPHKVKGTEAMFSGDSKEDVAQQEPEENNQGQTGNQGFSQANGSTVAGESALTPAASGVNNLPQ
jgi:type IV conjugative transfer system lipoprotein TraV